ncbi:unnamed protein product [Symbiodinium sp. CCMP2456]|nr:unnamed protein product [Symbiodinium sp. CCMP2456]
MTLRIGAAILFGAVIPWKPAASPGEAAEGPHRPRPPLDDEDRDVQLRGQFILQDSFAGSEAASSSEHVTSAPVAHVNESCGEDAGLPRRRDSPVDDQARRELSPGEDHQSTIPNNRNEMTSPIPAAIGEWMPRALARLQRLRVQGLGWELAWTQVVRNIDQRGDKQYWKWSKRELRGLRMEFGPAVQWHLYDSDDPHNLEYAWADWVEECAHSTYRDATSRFREQPVDRAPDSPHQLCDIDMLPALPASPQSATSSSNASDSDPDTPGTDTEEVNLLGLQQTVAATSFYLGRSFHEEDTLSTAPRWLQDAVERLQLLLDRGMETTALQRDVVVTIRATDDQRFVDDMEPRMNLILRALQEYDPIQDDPVIDRMGAPSQEEITELLAWLTGQLRHRWLMQVCPIATRNMIHESTMQRLGYRVPVRGQRSEEEEQERRTLSRSRTPHRRPSIRPHDGQDDESAPDQLSLFQHHLNPGRTWEQLLDVLDAWHQEGRATDMALAMLRRGFTRDHSKPFTGWVCHDRTPPCFYQWATQMEAHLYQAFQREGPTEADHDIGSPADPTGADTGTEAETPDLHADPGSGSPARHSLPDADDVVEVIPETEEGAERATGSGDRISRRPRDFEENLPPGVPDLREPMTTDQAADLWLFLLFDRSFYQRESAGRVPEHWLPRTLQDDICRYVSHMSRENRAIFVLAIVHVLRYLMVELGEATRIGEAVSDLRDGLETLDLDEEEPDEAAMMQKFDLTGGKDSMEGRWSRLLLRLQTSLSGVSAAVRRGRALMLRAAMTTISPGTVAAERSGQLQALIVAYLDDVTSGANDVDMDTAWIHHWSQELTALLPGITLPPAVVTGEEEGNRAKNQAEKPGKHLGQMVAADAEEDDISHCQAADGQAQEMDYLRQEAEEFLQWERRLVEAELERRVEVTKRRRCVLRLEEFEKLYDAWQKGDLSSADVMGQHGREVLELMEAQQVVAAAEDESMNAAQGQVVEAPVHQQTALPAPSGSTGDHGRENLENDYKPDYGTFVRLYDIWKKGFVADNYVTDSYGASWLRLFQQWRASGFPAIIAELPSIVCMPPTEPGPARPEHDNPAPATDPETDVAGQPTQHESPITPVALDEPTASTSTWVSFDTGFHQWNRGEISDEQVVALGGEEWLSLYYRWRLWGRGHILPEARALLGETRAVGVQSILSDQRAGWWLDSRQPFSRFRRVYWQWHHGEIQDGEVLTTYGESWLRLFFDIAKNGVDAHRAQISEVVTWDVWTLMPGSDAGDGILGDQYNRMKRGRSLNAKLILNPYWPGAAEELVHSGAPPAVSTGNEAEADAAYRAKELQDAADAGREAAALAAAEQVAKANAEAAEKAREAEAAHAARLAAEQAAEAAMAEAAQMRAEAEEARRQAEDAQRVKTSEAKARRDAEKRQTEAEEAMKVAAKQATEAAAAAKAQARAASEAVRSAAGSQVASTEVVSDADAARRSEDLRQQAQEELQRAQGSGVPQLPLSQLEQNRSTLLVSATDAAQMGELTSRSLGKISATGSEVLRDVFDIAAISLVADIVDVGKGEHYKHCFSVLGPAGAPPPPLALALSRAVLLRQITKSGPATLLHLLEVHWRESPKTAWLSAVYKDVVHVAQYMPAAQALLGTSDVLASLLDAVRDDLYWWVRQVKAACKLAVADMEAWCHRQPMPVVPTPTEPLSGQVPAESVNFVCPWCPATFPKRKHLGAHMARSHGVYSPVRHIVYHDTCVHCLRCFRTIARHQAHLKHNDECLMQTCLRVPTMPISEVREVEGAECRRAKSIRRGAWAAFTAALPTVQTLGPRSITESLLLTEEAARAKAQEEAEAAACAAAMEAAMEEAAVAKRRAEAEERARAEATAAAQAAEEVRIAQAEMQIASRLAHEAAAAAKAKARSVAESYSSQAAKRPFQQSCTCRCLAWDFGGGKMRRYFSRGIATDSVSLANQLAEAGEAQKVRELLEPLLTGGEKKPFLFNIVLKAYANAADLLGAEAWYRRMLASKVSPNVKTFGKLCKSAAKARQPLSAERWFFRAAERLPVSSVHLGTLLDACKEDPQRGESWLRRKELLNLDLPKSSEEVAPTSTSPAAYGASLAAWAKSGDLRSAEMAFHRAVREGGVSSRLWAILLDAYSKSSATAKAAEWFQAGIEMHLKPCAVSYTSVMDAFARTRDSPAAEKWMLALIRDGIRLENPSCVVLLGSWAKMAEVERVEAWMGRMRAAKVYLDIMAHTALISACAAAGDAEKAEAVLQELCTAGLEPDVVPHTAVVQAHLKSHHPERLARACNAMERMMSDGIAPNALSFGLLIGGFASEGHTAEAEDWYARMRWNLRAADLVAHNAVINAAARAGDAVRAQLWWERLEASELPADATSMNTVLDAVVRAAPEEALVSYQSFQKVGSRREMAWPTEVTFAILMRPFALGGDLKGVDRLWQQMVSDGIRPQPCNLWAVLSACANSNPMLPDTAVQRYQDWVQQGGSTDRHVVSALRAALGETKLKRTKIWSSWGSYRGPYWPVGDSYTNRFTT